jgi:hypothetical protein
VFHPVFVNDGVEVGNQELGELLEYAGKVIDSGRGETAGVVGEAFAVKECEDSRSTMRLLRMSMVRWLAMKKSAPRIG